MPGRTCFEVRNGPRTLTLMTKSKSSSATSCNGILVLPVAAALFTRMSIWPRSRRTSPTADRTDASSVTSAWKPRPWPENSLSSAANAFGSRSKRATKAPPAPRRRAIASPMPDAPPVMTAVCPLKGGESMGPPIRSGIPEKFKQSGARTPTPARQGLASRQPLAGVTRDPLVALDGVPPEVLPRSIPPLVVEILLDNLEPDRDGQPLVAVRPVAPVEHAVVSEDVHDLVEPRAVEPGVRGDAVALDPAQHLRNLHVDLRPVPESLHAVIVGRKVRAPGGRHHLRQVVDDHAKAGHPVAHAHDVGQKRHARVRRVQHQVGVGQGLQVGDELRLVELRARVPSQPVADPAEERVLVETLEIRPEVGRAGHQVPDGAHHDVVLARDIEHPLVVLEPAAALDLNGANDAQRLADGAVARRQRRLVQYGDLRVGPWRALGTERIEQMDVGVDDGHRRRCGRRGWQGLVRAGALARNDQATRAGSKECSPIHGKTGVDGVA